MKHAFLELKPAFSEQNSKDKTCFKIRKNRANAANHLLATHNKPPGEEEQLLRTKETTAAQT
jgi:hypothetical protein